MADIALAPVHPLPTPKLGRDKTAAERQRRYRERNKEPVTAATPPPVTPTVTVGHSLAGRNVTAVVDVAAYAAAIALAAVAAVFSIRGMVVLFPGAASTVVAMAGTMEAAKLLTAGWLASRWHVTPWLARLTLVTLIAGLAVINAAGVYAQLVAAHVGLRGEAAFAQQVHDAELAAKIDVQAHVVADLDRRLGQIDSAIEEAASERNEAAGTLATLKTERAQVAARGHQQETESAPIRYVAELVGADTDSERAIRWLIALIILCCDPLAIALTAAASAGRARP
jgi:hypothetical protein